jgi:hypothetical protein
MKHKKILRIFGLIIVFSLLFLLIPASPAFAWYDIYTSPILGKVGDTITLYGTSFSLSTAGSNPAMIYFTNQNFLVGQSVDISSSAKTILLKRIDDISSNGTFTTTFVVPNRLNDLSEVLPGTYYLYSCQPPTSLEIRNKVAFTVTGGTCALSSNSGIVNSQIQITGNSFPANSQISVQFDLQAAQYISGNLQTDSTGAFFMQIAIPPAFAGAHKISVTVAGNTKEMPYTIVPNISISPQSGKTGDLITVTGTGFSLSSAIILYFNSTAVGSGATADTYGSFSGATFTVPSGLLPNVYAVEAKDQNVNTASQNFTLQAAPTSTTTSTTTTNTSTTTTTTTTSTTTTPPTSTTTTSPGSISPPEGTYAVGAGIIISGTGMKPDTEISIKFDGKQITSVATTAQGILIAPVTVPVASGGTHIITATDGTTTIQVTIEIESTPPPLPVISSPEAGARAGLPLTFKWSGVTDPSSPVVYDFQIATSSSFSEGTVIVSKSGLTSPTYILTAAEQQIITSKDITYYCRVSATDAASNKSVWTSGVNFAVAAPFKFIGWPLYTILGIAAVLIFAIGYLLGRRTAFKF